jgi:Tfp pilus assembly protein PilO
MVRFIYGFILGVLTSVILAILYLAFAGGDYLLLLSPKYHQLQSENAMLKQAKDQRDQLASRLEAVANQFDQLTRRFAELQGSHELRPAPMTPETPKPAPANP